MADDGLRIAIGHSVSRETVDRLRAYADELARWTKRINLVAPSTLDALWDRHIVDSAQLIQHAPTELRWLDIGSGGGLPGAVVAILLMEQPGASIHLIESNGKKAAFLKTVLGSLGAPATVENARIEASSVRSQRFDVVTARALADLSLLFTLSQPWLSAGARGLFHKGRDYRREVEETKDDWTFDLIEHPSVVDTEGVILDVSNLARNTGN